MIPFIYFLGLSAITFLIYKFMSWQYHCLEKKMRESTDKLKRDELKEKMDSVQMTCTIFICIISILIAISFIVTLIAFLSHLLTYI